MSSGLTQFADALRATREEFEQENDAALGADAYHQQLLDQQEQEKCMDDRDFLSIIKRQVKDKQRRKSLCKLYFGEQYDENFGDC